MGNLIRNGGLLDGVTDWTASAGATRAVDETSVGAEGRLVLAVTRGVSSSVSATSSTATVTAGEPIEVMGLVGNSVLGSPQVSLEVVNGGGAVIGSVAIGYRRQGQGAPRRGLPLSFHEAYGVVAAPATGNARFVATSTGAAGAHVLYVLKPYVGRPLGYPARWDPGAHTNLDMNLPVWPSTLPHFRGDPALDPYPDFKEFAGDAGLPTTTPTYAGLHHRFRGQMRLTQEQADALDQFYASRAGEFYMVRPDNDTLCVAEWLADGAPRPVGSRGQFVFVEVGLHLRVA